VRRAWIVLWLVSVGLAGSDEHMTHARDEVSVTEHEIRIDGETIAYEARAGTLVLRKEDGTPRASIFYTAYLKKGEGDPAKRPLTFSFNGGPGSSSVWLHLGLLGPKIVEMDEEGFPLPPPYRLVDNPWSLLDETDLVFIDPVSTGYSRAVSPTEPNEFHGLEKDIAAVGEFIRLWITRNARWSSPKLLIGESYGTTRAVGLAGHLQDQHRIYLNGLMLVSSILNFQTARFDTGNDLPYIVFLPTYAATAWYHKRVPEDLRAMSLEDFMDEVRAFAIGPYASALLRGAKLDEATRTQIVEDLSRYTGLSPEYIRQTNLRINIRRFIKELRRDERVTVGRLDSRFTGIDRDAAGDSPEFDPSMEAIDGPYAAALNDYVRRELGFESDLPYEILTGRVRPWDYTSHQNRYVDMSETLRRAMSQNRDLKVYVANGYYDLATPFFATEYTFDHLHLDPSLRDNIRMSYYPAGHMMYIQLASLKQQKEDLADFIQWAK